MNQSASLTGSAESYEQMSALADQARQDAHLQNALRFSLTEQRDAPPC